MTTNDLTDALRRTADGDPCREAAVDLLVQHGHWLYNQTFLSECIDWTSHDDSVRIDFDSALQLLDASDLPCSASEAFILRVAASLHGADSVLRLSRLNYLDDTNVGLVTSAIAHACSGAA